MGCQAFRSATGWAGVRQGATDGVGRAHGRVDPHLRGCARSAGFAGATRCIVVMNRDERRDRAPARPPRRWRGADGGFTAPVDGDAGGTWIAAKDSGVVLALLNHQAPDDSGVVRRGRGGPPDQPRRSGHDAGGGSGGARCGPPPRRGARLVCAVPAVRRGAVGSRRACSPGTAPPSPARRLDPRLGFLTSSSWNPRAVIPARHARFRAFARRHPRPTRADLARVPRAGGRSARHAVGNLHGARRCAHRQHDRGRRRPVRRGDALSSDAERVCRPPPFTRRRRPAPCGSRPGCSSSVAFAWV